MQVRVVIYLLLFAIIMGAVAYTFIYFYAPTESPGRGYGAGTQRYIWIPITIVPVTFCVGLAAYVIMFPEIKKEPQIKSDLSNEPQPLVAVTKVLKDDERKVVELLISSGGKMLQRDIARQTGFSRVKTHRVLYRLSARGIVTAEKHYNTYEISLADWLLLGK